MGGGNPRAAERWLLAATEPLPVDERHTPNHLWIRIAHHRLPPPAERRAYAGMGGGHLPRCRYLLGQSHDRERDIGALALLHHRMNSSGPRSLRWPAADGKSEAPSRTRRCASRLMCIGQAGSAARSSRSSPPVLSTSAPNRRRAGAGRFWTASHIRGVVVTGRVDRTNGMPRDVVVCLRALAHFA